MFEKELSWNRRVHPSRFVSEGLLHFSEVLGRFSVTQLIGGQTLLKPAWLKFCAVSFIHSRSFVQGWSSGGQYRMSCTMVAVDCGKLNATYSSFVKDDVILCFPMIDSTMRHHMEGEAAWRLLSSSSKSARFPKCRCHHQETWRRFEN